jgi:hypothetical protein
MIDAKDVSQEKAAHYEKRARRVIENLQRRGMNGLYVPDRPAALAAVMDMIPLGAVVARGDSMSADQVGVIPEIIKRNQNKLLRRAKYCLHFHGSWGFSYVPRLPAWSFQ